MSLGRYQLPRVVERSPNHLLLVFRPLVMFWTCVAVGGVFGFLSVLTFRGEAFVIAAILAFLALYGIGLGIYLLFKQEAFEVNGDSRQLGHYAATPFGKSRANYAFDQIQGVRRTPLREHSDDSRVQIELGSGRLLDVGMGDEKEAEALVLRLNELIAGSRKT